MADFLHRRIKLRLPPSADENLGALIGKALCRGQSDTRATPGNNGYFAFEFPAHDTLRFDEERPSPPDP
jgi:hypothetical protein